MLILNIILNDIVEVIQPRDYSSSDWDNGGENGCKVGRFQVHKIESSECAPRLDVINERKVDIKEDPRFLT